MPLKKLTLLLLVSFAFSCQKEEPDLPANHADNNNPDDCATCPSVFYTLQEAPSPIATCDDFTDDTEWPDGFFNTAGETIGLTQNDTQPVVLGEGAFCEFGPVNPGLYGLGPILFSFPPGEKLVRFEIYGFYVQYGEMSLEINGNDPISLTAIFPLEIDGITVDLDTSIADDESWENAHLTFQGDLTSLRFSLFESGIKELCVTYPPAFPLEDKEKPVYFDNFINYSGTVLGFYPNAKTPLGYYGEQGANLSVNFDQFLAYSPTRISFVHAYPSEVSDYLVNLRLPETPLIVTTPDSLDYHLTPYGYTVEYYTSTGSMWENATSAVTGAQVDSFIVKGNSINQLTVGAQLQASELRSICTYYETE